jgi:hypothetical protein
VGWVVSMESFKKASTSIDHNMPSSGDGDSEPAVLVVEYAI